MSLSFNSISETAIGELPGGRVIADLEIELFSDISVARNLPQDTLSLSLNYDNDVVYVTYYGGNKDPWQVPLEVSAASQFQNVYNFVDTASLTISSEFTTSTRLNSVEVTALEVNSTVLVTTRYEIPQDTISLTTSIDSYEQPSWLISDPAVLSIDGEYFHNLKLFSTETGILSIEVIERQFAEDSPSEDWRTRPGLPIGPISVNTISVEQSEGPAAKSFPVIEDVGLELAVDSSTSTRLNYTDSGVIVLTDSNIESQSYNFVEQGNLTTVSITDQVVFLNSSENLNLEISAQDQTQQIYNFVDTVSLETSAEETTSSALNSIDSGNLTTITIRDVVVFLNSYETANLEIAAQDQIQQVFEFFEVAEINVETSALTSSTLTFEDTTSLSVTDTSTTTTLMNYVDVSNSVVNFETRESKLSNYSENVSLTTEPNDLISVRYYSFETSVATISAKTFAKEYTFLQQEFANDTYELKLSAESSESFRSSSGVPVVRGKQFWIG